MERKKIPKPIFQKPDKIILAMGLTRYGSLYQNWYLSLKKLCKKLIVFNSAKTSLLYGQDYMNNELLNLIKKEIPDYIFFYLTYDEIYLETLLKIKEILPKTKIVNFFSDDDTQFEDFSRYCALFCDYNIICQPNFLGKYKKEGIKNVFPVPPVANTDNFKPLGLEKKYDVSFIGTQKGNRYKIIKYLKDNGIKIKLYGWFWDKYPEFKEIYYGIPNNKEIVKIINQTKINLSFSENKYNKLHYKGRLFEVAACKSFVLEQYFQGYLNFFKNNKEIVMFKNKEDLLKKINYYLKHEEEREKIAERAYKKMIKNYNLNLQLKEFFKKTLNKKATPINFPIINKKIALISEEDIKLGLNELKKKLSGNDYICFIQGKCKHLLMKNYLQTYSLKKSRKQISCCSYYVHSKRIGNYLFWHFDMMEGLTKEEFYSLLDINQLMVTKEFFLENFNLFKKTFDGEKIDFINEKNTVFVSLPLIQTERLKVKNYNTLKKVFRMKFLHKLYSIFYTKKLLSSRYPYNLILEILKGKFFIFQALIETLFDKGRKTVLRDLKEC